MKREKRREEERRREKREMSPWGTEDVICRKERRERKERKERCSRDVPKMLLAEMLKTKDILAEMFKIWKVGANQ